MGHKLTFAFTSKDAASFFVFFVIFVDILFIRIPWTVSFFNRIS